jgi:hypothetical protein
MSTQEATRKVMPRELVDGRICPANQVIDWETTALSPCEVALVNHVHGLLGDHIMGPEEVKIAIGLRTLGELQAFQEDSQQETERQSDERPLVDEVTSFAMTVTDIDRKLSKGLNTTLSNLVFAEKWGEIVPEVVRRFSFEIPTPEGVIEDLSSLELQRAIVRQATREGVSRTLRLGLELYVDRLMTHCQLDGNSPAVTLDLDDGEEVAGQLGRVYHDFEGKDWLEVHGEEGQQRVSHDRVKMIGITVTRPEMDEEPETLSK